MMTQNKLETLYPEIEPFDKNWLKVDDLHTIYYEQSGNPEGVPVIFLHGGPGSGCNSTQRRFFDPAHYRIILMDQRGCGLSKPQGETVKNMTEDLVSDIIALKKDLSISKWHVFGGSWGSTLALAYALKAPQDVLSLTLRGIFLSRPKELTWFLGDVQAFFPEAWQSLVDFLPENERKSVLAGYAKRIFTKNFEVCVPAALKWNAFENAIMRLNPVKPDAAPSKQSPADMFNQQQIEVARARIQIHYIQRQCFIDGSAMLAEMHVLKDIPTTIVQGRYDMVCPPQTAWALAQTMPHANLIMVNDAGHSAMEPGITSALVNATNQLRSAAKLK